MFFGVSNYFNDIHWRELREDLHNAGGGVQPRTKNDAGHTPLHLLAIAPIPDSNLLQIMRHLLDRVPKNSLISDLCITDDRGNSFYHFFVMRDGDVPYAVYSIFVEWIETFFASGNGNDDTFALNLDGKTPLHIATECGNDVFVRIMIKYDSKYDQQDASGSTPLHYAISSRNVTSIRSLLRVGASRTLKNSEGFSPFEISEESGDEAIHSLLCDSSLSFESHSGSILLYDPPSISIASHDFFSESDIEISVSRREFCFVHIEFVTKWCLIELPSSKKGIVPHSCVASWSNSSDKTEVNWMKLDYLLSDAGSLYHQLIQGGMRCHF